MRLLLSVCLFASLSLAPAQSPGLRGVVSDPSGASVPGAIVLLRGESGRQFRQTTNELGAYELGSVPAGVYTLRVLKTGFAPFEVEGLEIRTSLSMNVQLVIATEAQTITVREEVNRISLESTQNASQLVLKEEDLKALSDDPDMLAQELQALAGPGAGPNGGQIFIDGFTGGRIPPKSSIREVRINQNPYSAEYDRIGFGRIEIFTKPGTGNFRGDAFFGFSDESLNSRNPFAVNRAPYQSRQFGARLSGPINKRASFSFDAEARNVDENAVVNATILNSSLLPERFEQAFVTPQSRYHISPRLDYQLNDRNTLVARYSYSPIRADNRGIGDFSLPSRAFSTRDGEHTLQLTETAVLSARAINETRFQYQRSNFRQDGDNTLPAIDVLDAFSGGGAQIGVTNRTQRRLEAHNLTTLSRGAHSIKFGGRLRYSSLDDLSPSNFGGTFTFAGGTAPMLDAANQPIAGQSEIITSLERYRRTLLFSSLGYTMPQILALGGGATQFTINGGNPLASVRQTDVGVFITEDWRLRPTLTLSAGLRWEDQTNISNHNNFAPRVGLAWALDGGSGRQAKTVLRAGGGIFYDRIDDSLTLQALRFNGVNQVNYIVRNPTFFTTIPDLTTLAANRTAATVRELYSGIRTPYLAQYSIGIDRQLPRSTSVAVNYVASRGVHLLRARNINAPLNGVYPLGDAGNVFLYESTGFSRQNMLITNFSTRFAPRLSLFGFYMLGFAKSDTDGAGSFPANTYDLSNEYGWSRMDTRHRFLVGGAIQTKWGVSFNPFIIASTGTPFNIITGRDTNGDTLFLERPAFATNPAAPGVVQTRWGNFLLNPAPGDTIIPRNYGRGPGQFIVNLRVGKTWGFGERRESTMPDGPPPGMGAPGGRGGPGGGPPGGMIGPPPGGGGRGAGGGFFGASTGKRYNLTLSIQARNLLNTVNPAAPNGNLSSPLFGVSTQLAGFFGPGGGGAAGNRRVELQLRFSF
jgi:hypothetical protein